MMTVREVAARLRVSRATVYRLVAEGELMAVRVSNAIRIREREVESFVAAAGSALGR